MGAGLARMGLATPRRLLGVVSAMIVWAAWFVAVYSLTGVGCRAGWHHVALPGGNLLSAVMLLCTAAALGLILECGRRGHAAWRGARHRPAQTGAETVQRQRFLGLTMLLVSALAAIGTLLVAVPIFMLDPCRA